LFFSFFVLKEYTLDTKKPKISTQSLSERMQLGELRAFEENLDAAWPTHKHAGWVAYPTVPPPEWLFCKDKFEEKARIYLFRFFFLAL
jgi:hypothetical protein